MYIIAFAALTSAAFTNSDLVADCFQPETWFVIL